MKIIKKIISIFISIFILFTNISTCLTGIVYAASHEHVHVVFTADKEITLENNKIIYELDNYEYKILIVEKVDEENEIIQPIIERMQNNDFAAQSLTNYNNMYLKIESSEGADESKIILEVDGHPVEMDKGHSVKNLDQLVSENNDCINVFIRTFNNNNPMEPGNPVESGSLEFELGQNDNCDNKTITYENGYKLTI